VLYAQMKTVVSSAIVRTTIESRASPNAVAIDGAASTTMPAR
jgi:hypothetical protein